MGLPSPTKESIDQLWMKILLDILPELFEVENDKNKLELLTRSNYVLDFICDMLERQLEASSYQYETKFRQFLNHLRSKDSLTPETPETGILTWLVRHFLVPSLNGVKRSNEEIVSAKGKCHPLTG